MKISRKVTVNEGLLDDHLLILEYTCSSLIALRNAEKLSILKKHA